MPTAKTHTFETAALALAGAVVLSACGGGATTGPLVQKDAASQTDAATGGSTTGGSTTTPAGWINTARVFLTKTATGAAVTPVVVGVLDGYIDETHAEIKTQVKATAYFGDTPPLKDDPHGTNVAQVLAGKQVGYTGNASLLLASTADSTGTITYDAVNKAGEWLFNQGAKVVNISYKEMYFTDTFPDLYKAAVANKGVVVMGAGNESMSITGGATAWESSIFYAGNEAAKAVSLVVGAINPDNTHAYYSNIAGSAKTVQDRFLVAVGSNYVQPSSTATGTAEADLKGFHGTSSATPVVAAAATTLFAYWPHLTGQEVSSLLLSTTDRTFTTEYSNNTCGLNNEHYNCGLYYYGQGKLDLAKAMRPVGPVSLPVGLKVGAESNALTSTSLRLPLAFGDALQGKQIDAVGFDSYGRDFTFNLKNAISSQASRLNLFGLDKPEPMTNQAGSLNMRLQLQSNNAVSKLAMSYTGGPATVNLDHGLSTEAKASNFGFGLSRSTTADAQAMTTGLGVSFATSKNTSVQLRSETGTAYRASRHELALSMHPADGATVTVGQSLSAENALLGAAGTGGLAVNTSTGSGSFLRLSQNLGQGWSVFGHAEIGTLAVQGNNTLTAFRDVHTSQFGLGLAKQADNETLGFALSQPLRADRAQADFRVATGRTLTGDVNYAVNTLSLTPSGRQMDLDVSYKRYLSRSSSVGVQATYSQDAGHVAGAKEYGVAAKYRMAF